MNKTLAIVQADMDGLKVESKVGIPESQFWELCLVSGRDTHLYRFSEFLDNINKQKPHFFTVADLSFSATWPWYLTYRRKNNITTIVYCDFEGLNSQ